MWYMFRPEHHDVIVAPEGTPVIPPTNTSSVPMFRGGLDHTGVMPRPSVEGTSTVKWTYDAVSAGRVISSPAVADGVVFFGSGDYAQPGTVTAVDGSSGDLVWKADLPGEGYSSPAVDQKTVYIASERGDIYAFDAATGRVRWKYSTIYPVLSSPAVANGLVYAGDDSGGFYAIDNATGNERWQRQLGVDRPVIASPAVANGVVYIGVAIERDTTSSEHLAFYALDAASGEEIWRFELKDGTSSSAAVVDNVVYFGSLDHYLYALDARTGRQIWALNTVFGAESSPAVIGGTIYVGVGDPNLGTSGYLCAITSGPSIASPNASPESA